MKLFKILFLSLLLVSLASCIQDEPLNMEADIEAVLVSKENSDVLLFISDTLTNVTTDDASKNICITKNPQADVTNIALNFKLTEGASIVHVESGKDGQGLALDFTEPQMYKVTSEDGNWSRVYRISFENPIIFDHFDFEHFEMLSGGRYINYYEVNESKRYDIWATGNPGYAMSGGKDFPTTKYDNGFSGNGVKLKTVSTGAFGAALKMPIAAGNLFFGTFDSKNALKAPLSATQFGIPFNKVPKTFSGYYMFTPGPVMTDANNNPIEARTDLPDFYVVMYENQIIEDGVKKSVMLDGNNILSSDCIVGMARIINPVSMTKEQIARGEWQKFEIPFRLLEGKSIDKEKLANYGYNVAMVFSSSIEGAYFVGAVGSTLYIDSVELICE